MGKKLLGAMVALLAFSGVAQAETCSLPKVADSVALNPVPGSDLMTVPVAINGAPKHFLLDIGTNSTAVAQAAAAQLGLPQSRKNGENVGSAGTNMRGLTSMGRPDLESLTNGGLTNVPVYDASNQQGSGALQTHVRVSSFAIGGATAHDMVFLVSNDAAMGSGSEPYDGLLTGDFFKQYDVEIDFGNKQINWLTPTACTDPNQVVFWSHSDVAAMAMTISPTGKMQLPVTINGHSINAVIDMGSPQTVMRRDVAELGLGLKPDTPEMTAEGNLKDSLGAQVYKHTFSQLAFEGVAAKNVPVLIATNSMTQNSDQGHLLGSRAQRKGARIPDLSIGMDVLRQLHLYVVYGQQKLYVTAAK